MHFTDKATLEAYVYRLTGPGARRYENEGRQRPYETVHHGR